MTDHQDDNTHDEEISTEEEKSSLSDRGTAVGLSMQKKLGIVAIVLGSTAFVLYTFVFSAPQDNNEATAQNKPKAKKETLDKMLKASDPVTEDVEDELKVALADQLPSIPELTIPEAPTPPPPPDISTQEENNAFDNPFSFLKKSSSKPDDTSDIPNPFENTDEKKGATKSAPMPLPPSGVPDAPIPQGVADIGAPAEPLSSKKLDAKTKDSRIKSSMIAYGGGKNKGSGGGILGESENVTPSTPLRKTSAKQIANSYYGDKRHTIVQGKIIEIVLETAINTDLKGLLRGIVSRDVYSESGTNILIPKGSKVIGTYSSNLSNGQSRVAVVWTRIIRPDGTDINLSAPATDRLGRSGITGEVDYHFSEVLRNSILVSLLTIVSGVIVSEIFDDDVVTQTVNQDTGSVTTSSTGAHNETMSAITDITDKLSNYLTRSEPTTQTIRVHSGASVKAFIRDDIVFVGDTAFTYRGDG